MKCHHFFDEKGQPFFQKITFFQKNVIEKRPGGFHTQTTVDFCNEKKNQRPHFFINGEECKEMGSTTNFDFDHIECHQSERTVSYDINGTKGEKVV